MTQQGPRTSSASLLALAMVGVLMIGFALYTRETNIREHRALVAGCERGNLLRADVSATVVALQNVLDFTAASIEHNIAAGDVARDRVAQAHASAAAYTRVARSLHAQPQVDCARAFP